MKEDLSKQCGDVAARVRACRNRKVAEMLLEQISSELCRLGQAPAGLKILQSQMKDLLRQTFDKNGKNRFLEAQ
jgi:hypothetical protein